jgi:hypothetical protein
VLLDRSWGKSVKAVEIHKLAEAQTHAFGEAPDKLSVKELEQLVVRYEKMGLWLETEQPAHEDTNVASLARAA